MKVAEMLRRGAILVPLDAPDLKWALTSTFRAVSGLSDEVAEKLAADLVGGASGEIHRVHERVVVALAESDAVEKICAVIGVSPVGFTADETDAASGLGAAEAGADGPAAVDEPVIAADNAHIGEGDAADAPGGFEGENPRGLGWVLAHDHRLYTTGGNATRRPSPPVRRRAAPAAQRARPSL